MWVAVWAERLRWVRLQTAPWSMRTDWWMRQAGSPSQVGILWRRGVVMSIQGMESGEWTGESGRGSLDRIYKINRIDGIF